MSTILTARRTRALVDRRDRRLGGGGFFAAVDDANDVLPPVDVVHESRLAEIAGLFAARVDREHHLYKENDEFSSHFLEKFRNPFLRDTFFPIRFSPRKHRVFLTRVIL